MQKRRRYVPGLRDFPQGCYFFSRHNLNVGAESKLKSVIVQAHRDFSDVVKVQTILESVGNVNDHQETIVIGENEDKAKKRRSSLDSPIIVFGLAAKSKCSRNQPRKQGSEEGLNNSRDVVAKEEPNLESNGGFKGDQEMDFVEESKDISLTKACSVKSLHEPMEVGEDLVDTSKRVLVLGLPGKLKCTRSQPRKQSSRHATDC